MEIPGSATPRTPERIFSWLVRETRDDRGNAIGYRYKSEDGAGVDLSAAHQSGRGPRNASRLVSRQEVMSMSSR